MAKSLTLTKNQARSWRDYVTLCKPRVVLLMILTSIVGMCLAGSHWPPFDAVVYGNLGIALVASAAAAINHFADYRWDCLMARTKKRPIVQGRVSPVETLIFAAFLYFSGLFVLCYWVNALTAVLTTLSLLAYAGVYTFYLKHATSQNIVIGGIAGAAPPLLGWVAVTGHIELQAVLLLLIIFVWTPPHFWALAIDRYEDYANADIPMLPNTHGIQYTKKSMIAYTLVLYAITLIPFFIHQSHDVYLFAALVLNSWFSYYVIKLYFEENNASAIRVFRYSIIYLLLLFVALLIDHFYVITSLY